MTRPFRIGIAGLGNIGCGVIRMIQESPELIANHAGREVEIICVSARERGKDRDVCLDRYEWLDDPAIMAGDPRLDAVVEVIGGAEGVARALVERCLKAGKPVITANKALLAEHGAELARLSDRTVTPLMYEAAVAGGIPIIKALREGYAANNIKAVYGILNGTCNYILTNMRETGSDFETVLGEAQAKGYAEADSEFDIDGIDAAHKLSILTALGFGVKPDFSTVHIRGIGDITADDIAYATELGYKIKLLGIARLVPDCSLRIVQRVEPCLVPQDSPVAAVDGVYNAVLVEGDFVGTGLLAGRGAGAGPTASAILSDIIDLARGVYRPVYGMMLDGMGDAEWGDSTDISGHFYIRLDVMDKVGVLADITALLREHGISVESVIQRSRDPEQRVSVVLTTHESCHAQVEAACEEIAALDLVISRPVMMRIEQAGL